MVEIPLEKKSRSMAFVWVMVLLFVGAAVWYLLAEDDENDIPTQAEVSPNVPGVVNPSDESVEGGTTATNTSNNVGTDSTDGRVVDVIMVIDAVDRTAFAGRSAELTGVRVVRVLSDRAFTVGTDSTKELFVMLDDSLDAGSAEKRIRIMEGERLSLTGTIDRPPTPETMAGRYRGLNAAEAKELRTQSVYLHATGVKEM